MTSDRLAPAAMRERGFVALFLANAWVVVLIWWAGSPSHGAGTLADVLNDMGRLTGLLGTYLVLVQLLLRTHVPWLVEALGKDALRAAHAWNAYLALPLLVAHGVLQTIGYALDDGLGVVEELASLVAHYDGVFLSIVSLAALVALTAVSVGPLRHRIPWPTWRKLHLTAYVAVALSVPHQLATGSSFVDAPLAVAYWWSLYAAIVGTIALTRVAPLWRAARERPLQVGAPVAAAALGTYLLLMVRVLPLGTDAAQAPATAPAGARTVPQTASPAPSSAATADASGRFVGEVIETPYGEAQVSIVVRDGRLTAVEVIRLPDTRRVSAQMSAGVEPYLQRRAIAAQSARFDVISGATYTSNAYMASLESALRAAADAR